MRLTGLFEEALVFACRVHAKQVRKGSATPYISHLLAVTAIALEYGADEEEAIAALLHNTVEDHGAALREEILARFGPRVLEIVDGCSDAQGFPKPPWRERKERYIAQVAEAGSSVQLVSASDKLHNLQSIVRDYRVTGEEVWARFSGGREGTLWYYREMIGALRAAPPTLLNELKLTLRELEGLLASRNTASHAASTSTALRSS